MTVITEKATISVAKPKTKPHGKPKGAAAPKGKQEGKPPKITTQTPTPDHVVIDITEAGSSSLPKKDKRTKKGENLGKSGDTKAVAIRTDASPSALKPTTVSHAPRVRFKLDNLINDSNGDETLALEFPGVTKPEQTNLGINAHSVLHNTRKFMEQDAMHMAHLQKATILLDVGGAATRAKKVCDAYGIGYHSCNPVIDSVDIIRQAKYMQAYPDNVCGHKAQDCRCVNFDVVNWTHSLYYFTEEEVARMLLRANHHTGFATVHEFHGMTGQFPQGSISEATWHREGDSVVMAVKGNNFTYKHDSLEWLQKAGLHVALEGEMFTMSWELVKEARGSTLYKFMLVRGDIPIASVSFSSIAGLPEDARSLMQISRVSEQRFFTVVTTTTGEKWAIHNELYGRCRSANAGKIPNQNAWSVLMEFARKQKDLTCDPQMHVRTVAMAFVHNATDLNEVQGSMSIVKDLLQNVGYLAHVAPTPPTLWELMGAWQRPFTDPLVAGALWVGGKMEAGLEESYLYFLLPIAVFIAFLVRQWRLFTSYRTPRTEKLPGQRVYKWCADPEMVGQEWEDKLQENLTQKAKNIEIPKFKTITGDYGIDSNNKDERQNILHGNTYKWFKPNLNISPNLTKGFAPVPMILCNNVGYSNLPSSTSDANKISALTNRLMKGLEHSSAEMVRMGLKSDVVIRRLGILPSAKDAKEYLAEKPVSEVFDFIENEYGGRSEPRKKNLMLQAATRVSEGRGRDEFYVEWFVKGENTPAKQDGNKLRGIFVPNPDWTVQVAPQLYRLTKLVVHHTQQIGSFITITSGMMAPQLGDWMDETVEAFGSEYFIMELDVSAFEANQTAEQNEHWFDQYDSWLGGDQHFYQLMMSSNELEFRESIHRGTDRTSWGKVGSRHGAMPSGVPDVTLRNSCNTIRALVGLLIHIGIPVEEFSVIIRALVLGDDNFSCIASRYRDLFNEEVIIKFYKRFFGWDVKVRLWESYELASAEYCSCYFAQTPEGHRITPKIGRILPKTFFLDQPLPKKASIVYGMVLGLGHFETGYTMSRILQLLETKCKNAGIVVNETLYNDFMWHPHLATSAVVLGHEGGIEADCTRYSLGSRDIMEFLQFFESRLLDSKFPYGPLILPAGNPVFKRFVDTDMPFGFDDVNGGRADLSRPHRNGSIVIRGEDYGSTGAVHITGALDVHTDVPDG